MKILLDTNVLLSAFISKGYSAEVVEDAFYRHSLFYSEYILNEFKRVAEKKFKLSDSYVSDVCQFIKKYYTRVKTAPDTENVCRDANDDQVLADAVFNKINLIITGDQDLLILKEYKNIKIISPREYWSL